MLMTYYCRGTFALLHPCKSFFIVYQCAYSPLLIKITKIIANKENLSSLLQCMFNSYLIVQIIFPIFMKECLRCGQQDYTTIMSVFYFLSFQDFQYITAYQDQHLNRELWEPEVLQFGNAETVLSYSLHKTRGQIM